MTNLVVLHFDVAVLVHSECADDLGKELAVFLQESFFNGEDVLEVEYKGHNVLM